MLIRIYDAPKRSIIKSNKEKKIDFIRKALTDAFKYKDIEITSSESLDAFLIKLYEIQEKMTCVELCINDSPMLVNDFFETGMETFKIIEIIEKDKITLRFIESVSDEFIQLIIHIKPKEDISLTKENLISSIIYEEYEPIREDFFKPENHYQYCNGIKNYILKFPHKCNCSARNILKTGDKI